MVGGALIGPVGTPNISQRGCAFVILPYDALIESNNTSVNVMDNLAFLMLSTSVIPFKTGII